MSRPTSKHKTKKKAHARARRATSAPRGAGGRYTPNISITLAPEPKTKVPDYVQQAWDQWTDASKRKLDLQQEKAEIENQKARRAYEQKLAEANKQRVLDEINFKKQREQAEQKRQEEFARLQQERENNERMLQQQRDEQMREAAAKREAEEEKMRKARIDGEIEMAEKQILWAKEAADNAAKYASGYYYAPSSGRRTSRSSLARTARAH